MNIDSAKGKNASGPITKHRFVKLDAAADDGESVLQCDTAGEQAFGVSLFTVSALEIARGKGASCITDGRAIVEAGGTVALSDPVTTDNVGRAVVAASGDTVLGFCDENAGDAGVELGVRLAFGGAVLA
jgi:hypothetical protein